MSEMSESNSNHFKCFSIHVILSNALPPHSTPCSYMCPEPAAHWTRPTADLMRTCRIQSAEPQTPAAEQTIVLLFAKRSVKLDSECRTLKWRICCRDQWRHIHWWALAPAAIQSAVRLFIQMILIKNTKLHQICQWTFLGSQQYTCQVLSRLEEQFLREKQIIYSQTEIPHIIFHCLWHCTICFDNLQYRCIKRRKKIILV